MAISKSSFFILASILLAFAVHADDVYDVTGDDVNVRLTPNGTPIGRVSSKDTLQADPTGRDVNGWVPVLYNGKKAYIFNSYVEKKGVERPATNLGKVSVDSEHGANLRESGSSKAKVIDNIPDNTEVTLTGKPKDGWVPVSWEGKKGWVKENLLEGQALDKLTDATHCDGNCGNKSPSVHRSADDLRDAAKTASELSADSKTLLARWSAAEAVSAMAKRHRARFAGGGVGVGNVSKHMCAQAVEEAAVNAGVCRPFAGAAITFYTNHLVQNSCSKHLKLFPSKDPHKAPPGSIIVYYGHAGDKPHHFGHTETTILVTPAVMATLGRYMHGLRLNQKLYCSDYCIDHPSLHYDKRTRVLTDPVAAIYTLD